MMANSARDPLRQAKISAEVDQVPAGLGLVQAIREKYSRCHMGMASYRQMANSERYGVH